MSLVYFSKMIEVLEASPELKRTFAGIAKQVGWAAAGTVLGGCFAGPPGAMIGGVLGSLYGYVNSDNYASLIVVLRNLSEKEKEQIVEKVHELVGSQAIEALVAYIQSEANRLILLNFLATQAGQATRGG